MAFSRIVSIVFHPIVIPLIGIFLLFHSGSWLSTISAEAKGYVYLVTATTSIVFPLISLYLMKLWGWISNIYTLSRKEQRSFLLMISFYMLIGAFVLQRVNAPLILSLYLNGISILLLICAVISFKWNISVYLLGLGGIIGLVLAISFKWMLDLRGWLAIGFIISALVATGRLSRNQHAPSEIYGGFLVGLCGIFLLIFFF